MSAFIQRKPAHSHARLCIAIWCGCLLTMSVAAQARKRVSSAQQRQAVVAPQCKGAGPCLSLGLFYFNNDDISDKAVGPFKTVITQFPKNDEAETAQYYLASYYQRKFYIQRERSRRDDPALLQQAQREFFTYIDRYSNAGSGKWLTDAHFNLALVFVQLRDQKGAANILDRMINAAPRDRQTYLYQVVWSPNPADVVDSYVDARALAEYTRSLVYAGQPCEQIMPTIRKWCQSQKSKKA
jgi:hypothetical protein